MSDFCQICRVGTVTEVRKLLDAGQNVNEKDNDGLPAILCSVWHNCNPGVAELLIQSGANLNISDDEGWTPLMEAIGSRANNDIIIKMIAAGADVNIKSKCGTTSLTVATWQGWNPELIITLIEHGVNINAMEQDGWTPIMWADVATAALLKNLGATPSPKGWIQRTSGEDGWTPQQMDINERIFRKNHD